MKTAPRQGRHLGGSDARLVIHRGTDQQINIIMTGRFSVLKNELCKQKEKNQKNPVELNQSVIGRNSWFLIYYELPAC